MAEEFKREYHKRCHDCGRFIARSRWVEIDHPWKKHALCLECHLLYDHPDSYFS